MGSTNTEERWLKAHSCYVSRDYRLFYCSLHCTFSTDKLGLIYFLLFFFTFTFTEVKVRQALAM